MVGRRYLLIYCFLFSSIISFYSNQSYAFDSTKTHQTTLWQDIGNDIMTSLDDAGAYVTLPLHFDEVHWFFTFAVLDALVISSTTDYAVKHGVNTNTKENYNHNFWDIPTGYGEPLTAGIISTGVYFTGLFTRNKSVRVTGRMLFESVAYAGALDLILKYTTGRDRPYYTDDQYRFKAFQTKDEHVSFPSGHCTMAFAVSTVLAERIDNIYARIGFYGFAGLTACTRIINNQHWLSDVIAGSLLGFGTGYFIVHQGDHRNNKRPQNGGFSLYPSLNGINFSWKF